MRYLARVRASSARSQHPGPPSIRPTSVVGPPGRTGWGRSSRWGAALSVVFERDSRRNGESSGDIARAPASGTRRSDDPFDSRCTRPAASYARFGPLARGPPLDDGTTRRVVLPPRLRAGRSVIPVKSPVALARRCRCRDVVCVCRCRRRAARHPRLRSRSSGCRPRRTRMWS